MPVDPALSEVARAIEDRQPRPPPPCSPHRSFPAVASPRLPQLPNRVHRLLSAHRRRRPRFSLSARPPCVRARGELRPGRRSRAGLEAPAAPSPGRGGLVGGWWWGRLGVGGECENPECREAVHGTGNYWVDYSQKSNRDEFEYQCIPYSSYYTVTHLHPPMLMMPIPKVSSRRGPRGCPARISRALR